MKPGEDIIGVNVAFYCHDGKGNFLLHKRSQKCRDERGVWDVGGGQLEFGERLGDGVLREVEEEYGCRGVVDERLMAFSSLHNREEKDTHWVCVPFIVRVNVEQVQNNDPEKIDEISWFEPSKFPSPIHPNIPIAMKRNKEIFQKYFK